MDRALEVYYEEATVTLGWRVAAPWVHAIATSTPVAKMAAAHVGEARRTVGTLEGFLSADPYFAGDGLSLADVAISSLFEHLSTFDDYQRLVPLGSSLREWFSRVSARAAFESTRQRGGAIPGLVLAA